MKNLLKLLGIIAIVAMVGFSIVSCSDGGSGNPAPVTPPPVEPEIPDYVWTGTWYVEIEPTEISNGLLRADWANDADKEDLYANVILYALGYDNILPVTFDADTEDVILIGAKDGNGDPIPTTGEITYVAGDPADPTVAYNFSSGETKVFIPSRYIDPSYSAKFIQGQAFSGPDAKKIRDSYVVIQRIIDEAFTDTLPYANSTASITEVTFAFDSEITSIGENAFKGKNAVTGIVDVPSSVTHISAGAFETFGTSAGVLILNGSTLDVIEQGAFSSLATGRLIVYGLTNLRAANNKFNKVWREPDNDANPVVLEGKTTDWTSAYTQGQIIVRPFR